MDQSRIRNFSIIAHVDHGKSTLADRLLEQTHTIEARQMKEQVLDRMDLERERGITIKMQPVRMLYEKGNVAYALNLIDTPGHIDFSYEVSRALTAVEGALLLVDATQGVQAQTLTTLGLAKELGLVIIPVVSKIDAPLARVAETVAELSRLLSVSEEDVIKTSGKTGEGALDVLDAVVLRVPPPEPTVHEEPRALIFDFHYSDHRGIILFCRLFDGSLKRGDRLTFGASRRAFSALEIGVLRPDQTPVERLSSGEIGYIVTGIKEPGVAAVGDSVLKEKGTLPPLSGYEKPTPMIWASVYPESQDDFVELRQALDRLHLSDSSLSYEEESSGVMGRGFRCGFLGMLHLEIITERLRREFALEIVITTPTITYRIVRTNGKEEYIHSPVHFPEHGEKVSVYEPWAKALLMLPAEYVGVVSQLLFEFEGFVSETETLPDGRISLTAELPLRELMRRFFDRLKSVTSGYASISYEVLPERPADVVRLDILVSDEVVPALSRIVSRKQVEGEAEKTVEKLREALPRQLVEVKIQARALGRILAARRISALRKDVTAKLYGGDVTRKKKLLEKQKKGKKKMQGRAGVSVPHDVYLKLLQDDGS